MMWWYIVLGLTALILFWRIVLPGMRLGVNVATHTPSPAGGGTAASASPPSISIKKWSASNWPSFLIATVGLMFIYWGFQNTQIGLADAGSWGRNHWVPLLTFWGVGATLIALNAEMLKKATRTLQWVLAGMMFMFFIGFPILGWFGESKTPAGQKQSAAVVQPERAMHSVSTPATSAAVPLATAPKSQWLKLTIEPRGRGDIQLPSGMHHFVVTGDKYRVHTVYADGRDCDTFGKETCPDGAVVEYYVSNDATEKNTILYAFVPQQ